MNKPKYEMTGYKYLDPLLMKINNGESINIQDNDGNTALIRATYKGDIEICKILIKNGADINIKNNDENSALICASWDNYIDICKLLIENGADINIQNIYGYTALISASLNANITVCEYLINNGADINIKDRYGYRAVDTMKNEGIYRQVEPYKILGLKHFHKVFKEHALEYIDIFNTTLYSQDLELEDIKANIEMFYSTIIAKMDNNAINESVEL